LKASLGGAVKQNQRVCKQEQFERQTVIDPIPGLLVCALPDGPLNLAAAHGLHHENRHVHSKFSTSSMVGDPLRVIASMTTQHASTSSGRDRTAKAREGCLGSRHKNGTSSQGFSTFQSLPYTALQSDRCLVVTTFCNLFAPFHDNVFGELDQSQSRPKLSSGWRRWGFHRQRSLVLLRSPSSSPPTLM
jgi:hypothetical protein